MPTPDFPVTKGKPLSTKIDFTVYLKGKLNNEFAKLTTGHTPNLEGAQNVQRLLGTNDHIHGGYFSNRSLSL